jgi:hypothetical protein
MTIADLLLDFLAGGAYAWLSDGAEYTDAQLDAAFDYLDAYTAPEVVFSPVVATRVVRVRTLEDVADLMLRHRRPRVEARWVN